MGSAEHHVRELWVAEFKAIRAYAYRATQGILAGHRKNPLFPPSDTIEEISADGIAEAYETTILNAARIMAWADETKRRKVLLGFVRNGCRHSIASYRKSRCHNLESELEQREGNQAEGFAELLLSLPPIYRETAELASRGMNNCEIAEEINLSEATIRRQKLRIGQLLGFNLFCRWIARSVESFA